MTSVRTSCLLCLLVLLCGPAPSAPRPQVARGALFQTSTISALMAGLDDGDLTFGELRRHGDFGLGTLDALDGEMVALDGDYYQVRSDGHVYRVPDAARTPFAVVKWFHAERTIPLQDAGSLADLERMLDAAIASPNVCTAIRIDGYFERVTTRSVPRQSRPYPPLATAAKAQKTFDLRDVEGTMVGFRTPESLEGVNVPGYHFHFLTAGRRAGGHVLACSFRRARAGLDTALSLEIRLPATPEFARANLSGQSREDLDRAERGSGK
jgi:acetolactate decarboxylase